MRIETIGDPHGRKEDLGDLDNLFEFCAALSCKEKAVPVLLGDLKHHHGIVYAEVMDFYDRWFRSTKWFSKPVVLVGNHDMVLGTKIHTLAPYRDMVTLITEPTIIRGVIFAPYMEDIQPLIEFCQSHPECNTLVFHATVDGAKYENGFPARDGVDQNLFPQKTIISGHIHRPGMIGKVHYVGAPRWMGVSDANTDRAVWVMDFDDSGNLLSKEPYTTNNVCRQILHFVDTESNPVNPSLLESRNQNIVDVCGYGEWVDTRSELFLSLGCKVRAFKQHQNFSEIRESDGVDVAFSKFCEQFKPEYGTPIAVLREMVGKRLHG